MKKYIGVLSLVVFLLTQVFIPFTYVYAVSEDDCKPRESRNEGLNQCDPQCTHQEYVEYGECKLQCKPHQEVVDGWDGYECDDKCSPDAIWNGSACTCLVEGEVRDNDKEACIPCDYLHVRNGSSCVQKEDLSKISFDIQGGSSKASISIPIGTSVRNLIERNISVNSEDMVFYPYSKYFTIPYANKLNMVINWTYNEGIESRSGVDSDKLQPFLKLKTKDEEKNFTLMTEGDYPEPIYHPPYNTGWNGNSGTFFGYGYGFTAIITGDTLEVEPNPLLTFDGWYTNPELTEELNLDGIIDTDTTLYGRYAAKVSFDTMGGNPIQDILITPGTLLDPIPMGTIRAYSTFQGWYTNKNLSDGFNESESINQNMTLYAKYECDNEDLAYTSNITGHNLGVYQCFGFNSLNIGAYTLMDRNLGAYSTGIWNSTNNSTGYYYQWGNNYGFSNVINSKGALIRLNTDSPYTSSVFGTSYEDDYDSEYYKSEYYYKNLRGNRSNNNQSRQGPCPEGWHVPTRGEWLGVIDAWIEKEDLSRGVDYYHNNKKEYTGFSDNSLADYLLFPTTNHVELSGDNAIYSGNSGIGGAWTAGYGYGFYFGKDENDKYYASVKEYVAALDFIPVRCFQNKTYLTFKDKRDTSKVYGVTGFVENEQNSIGNVSNFPAGIKYPEDASYYTGKILSDGTIVFSEISLNIESLLAQEFSEDTTIYVDYPRYTVRLHSLDNTDVEEYDVLYMKGNITTSEFDLPSLDKGGSYNFMGWFTGADYRDLGLSYSGPITSNLTGEGGVVDLYPHFSKDITITLKPNHNTIKSGDDETTSDIVINTTIYDNDGYALMFPQILNENTPNILGFTLGEETYTEPYYNSGEILSLFNSQIFYAQTKKDIGFTVVPNGNRISDGVHTYEGLQQYEETKTVYNGVNTETFTFPDILVNENTPDILGFSTGETYRPEGYEYYQTGTLITLSGSEIYYAQTKKDYEGKQAIFLKGQGVTQIGGSNEETLYDSCIPMTTYNSYVNDTCIVKAPSISVSAGQKPGKWNNEYVGDDDLILSQATSYFIAGTESNVYSVYYDYNGGSAGELHPSTYNGGETLTISDPLKPGYTFTGWTDQNGNSVVFPINSANGNYHITANWELTPYTITFAGIDETVTYEDNNELYPESRTCTYEDVFTLDTPSKPGYAFSGWQLEDGTIKKVVTISKTTSDRTLTGVWGSGTYNIVYNLNGGENDSRNPESYTYSTTEDVELYSGTRSGYRFDGWYNNRYFVGNRVTSISKGTYDHVVLHAKWTPIIYTITFNGVNGVKLENSDTPYPSSMTGVYDDVITLSAPSKEGYEFDGWSIGNSSTISKTLTLSKLTENKTITAHWTAKRYTITYNSNGGTNNVNNPESYIYSDESSVTLYSGTRVGYRFDGWYTSLNGGDIVQSIPVGAHENYVLYAHWTANTNTPYKVYHYQESLGGGHLLKDTDSLQGTSNAEVTPAVNSYEGFTAPETQTVTIRPDGETRVEYYYNRNSYSITVDYNGGKNSNNQSSVTYTKKYGDTIEEVIPTRDGYSFNGWSETYPKTMPVVAGTKTITASWTANAYTITYNNVEYADNSGNDTHHGYKTSEAFTLANAVWTGYQFNGWFTQAVGGTQVTAITANDHENKVLYAHWTPKTNVKYTVIHRRQGLDQYYNDDNLKEEVVYTDGVTATTIEAEQKNYPGFIPPEVKEITIKGDGTSVVEYRYQRMRFTYALEGNVGVDTKGTTANNQYMFYGAPLTLRATVDTGYSWSGWYIETGDNVYRLFTTEQNTTIKLPAFNSVVKPVVTHDVYTLSFNAAGGIATGTSSLVVQNHYYNDEITLPEVVRAGYIFQGWYTEPNGQGIKYEADTKMPVSNVELYAYWIEGEANVKVEYYLMNLDGSTYPVQPSDKIELQKTTNSTYTGEVKTFTGFNSPNEQSVVVEAEGTSVIKYYYPRFSYSLDLIGLTGFNYVSVVSTNHPDGIEIISGEVQSTNYYYGETITITGELLTGYGMDKWNGADVIGKNSGTPVFTFTMPAQTVELTPNVTKNTYKATYKDGDRVIAIYDVVYEEAVPTPKAPSKYGYKFTGWRNYPISGTMPANDVELRAMWEAVPVSGGSGGGGGSSSNDNKKPTNTISDKQQEHNSAELTGVEQKIDDVNKTGEESVKAEEESIKSEEQTIKSDEVDNNKEETNTSTNISTSDQGNVSQEVSTAYQWAYKNDVTTMDTIDEANPEGVVTRGHLAKMVVNYAINVLGKELPEKVPSECRWDDWRGEWESQEIKDYAVKACSLGLMGLDMNKFQPRLNVTRAQFGTIMSRLLWGKKYAGGTPYYKKHLNALKENNIMTQIQNPEKRTELRQWVWLMLMRSAENE